jgi:hypothetical protein
MDTAAEILVIITSSVLVIFLIVGIILAIYLIKLTAEIRKITRSAQNTVNHIDAAVTGITRISSPIFVAELLSKYIKKMTKKSSKKGDK